ncbi:hypothetical protein [Amycolatopsis sp. NPDC021455]|uniref:hypothetical protein n=1 Tax=Amycolatopsis sp. NPDC021455 TaxID=3154901 RepID=UPI0033D86B44
MTQTHHPIPRRGGQHRRHKGDIELRTVAAIWQRYHWGVPPWPIENLGMGNYTPRHAAKPVRRRVYLPDEAGSAL